MKFMLFEGTTSEFISVAPSLGLKQGVEVEAPNTDSGTAEAEESESTYLTTEQVKAVLTRRPLDWAMKLMLRKLYEAGGRRIMSDELREALGFSAPQFRGMMGAFGRRRANTEGVPPGARLFDELWDHDAHQKSWSLPSSTRTALKELELTKD